MFSIRFVNFFRVFILDWEGGEVIFCIGEVSEVELMVVVLEGAEVMVRIVCFIFNYKDGFVMVGLGKVVCCYFYIFGVDLVGEVM